MEPQWNCFFRRCAAESELLFLRVHRPQLRAVGNGVSRFVSAGAMSFIAVPARYGNALTNPDRPRSDVGFGTDGSAFWCDTPSRECGSRPRAICTGRSAPQAFQPVVDAPCSQRSEPAKEFFARGWRRWHGPALPVGFLPWSLLRRRRPFNEAGFPPLKLAGQILAASLAQVAHDSRIVGRQPVLQFVQRVHGFKN